MRTWNLGNWLVALGFVGLALSFWWPYVLAARVARVEGWAENIGRRLLAAAVELDRRGELDLAAPDAAAQLRAALGDTPEADRIAPAPAPAGSPSHTAWLRGKHYAYFVGRTPVRDPASKSPATQSIEVCAWPLSRLGPGQAVFFFPSDARAAYTHNLRARYTGFEHPPQPGWCRPDEGPEPAHPGGPVPEYRSSDGELWVWFPQTRRY